MITGLKCESRNYSFLTLNNFLIQDTLKQLVFTMRPMVPNTVRLVVPTGGYPHITAQCKKQRPQGPWEQECTKCFWNIWRYVLPKRNVM